MADLMGATEAEFTTDFAMVSAGQDDADLPYSGGFAGSGTGGIAGLAGTKYARIACRAERWTDRPASDDSWEDIDELPFEASARGGSLKLFGFDPPAGHPGLQLEGFVRGRVQVLARGRQRYHYGDHLEPGSIAPEEWLLRFYPVRGPFEPLAGGPRRLAGVAPFGSRTRTGWAASVHAWKQTGWSSHFGTSPGYRAVEVGMLLSERALSRRELALRCVPYIPRLSGFSPSSSVDAVDVPIGSTTHGADPLVVASGMPAGTLGQTIDALRELQLLLPTSRAGQETLVPNPDPGFIWERIDLTDSQRRAARLQIGYADFRHTAQDISNAIRWAGGSGLATSVYEMALRWSTTAVEIRGGIGVLENDDAVTVSWASEKHDDDTAPFVLRPAESEPTRPGG